MSILNVNFDSLNLRESLRKADIVLVTSIGTAAMEAVIYGKKMLFISILV